MSGRHGTAEASAQMISLHQPIGGHLQSPAHGATAVAFTNAFKVNKPRLQHTAPPRAENAMRYPFSVIDMQHQTIAANRPALPAFQLCLKVD